MTRRALPLRDRRAHAIALAALALVVPPLIAAAALPLVLRGERFGRVVTALLPEMEGRLQIGGGRWDWAAVYTLWRGRPAAIALDDVRLFDPQGAEVMRAGRVSGKIKRHPGGARVTVHDLRVEGGWWRFAEMSDGRVGFVAAWNPPGPVGRTQGGSRIAVDVVDAALDGVDSTFDLPGWGVTLNETRAKAQLGYRADGAGGPVLTFEVTKADIRGGGRLRVGPIGNAWVLPFTRARLQNVSTLATAPDTIALFASAIETGRSRTSISGLLTGVLGPARPEAPPSLQLNVDIDHGADAVQALAAGARLPQDLPFGGADAHLTGRFSGPTSAVRLDARAQVTAPGGGRLTGEVSVDGAKLAGQLTFQRFATDTLLPPALRTLASGVLDGDLRARADLATGTTAIDHLRLTLTRPRRAGGARIVRLLSERARPTRPQAAGTLRLPRLVVSFDGSRLAVWGDVALSTGLLDLWLTADRLSLDRLLGVTFVGGAPSFQARLRGTPGDLAIAIALPRDETLFVLGEAFRLPAALALRWTEGRLLISNLRLSGPDASELETSGWIDPDGRIALAIVARNFPFSRLPGLGQTGLPFAGQLSGQLRLMGAPARLGLEGQLSIDPVTFQGRRVGGGRIAITPEAGGGLHARGRLAEGIDAVGTLRPGPTGLSGEATLTLDRLRLDPFLAALPAGIRATGIVSGTVVARIMPGFAARAEGNLTALTLAVMPPPWATSAAPVELHAERDIKVVAEGRDDAGAGPIRLGPARFRGAFGSFALEGEVRGDSGRGTVQGRIDLDAFAPLTAAWVDQLGGAIDVDVSAARSAETERVLVNGELTIARPLTFHPRSLPIDVRLPAGRVRFTGAGVETSALPVVLPGAKLFVTGGVARPAIGPAQIALTARGELNARLAQVLAPAVIRRAEGGATLRASLSGTPASPALRARIDLRSLAVEAPALSRHPLLIAGGHLDLVSGRTDRQLLLSGDIILAGARIDPSFAAGRSSAPPSRLTQSIQLNVGVRSRNAAVTVELPYLPDLNLDVDLRLRGTLARPETVVDRVRPADPFSRFALWLYRVGR